MRLQGRDSVTDVAAIRARLASGELMDGDLSWCRQRVNALMDWPPPISDEQEAELLQLIECLENYG